MNYYDNAKYLISEEQSIAMSESRTERQEEKKNNIWREIFRNWGSPYFLKNLIINTTECKRLAMNSVSPKEYENLIIIIIINFEKNSKYIYIYMYM